jgi:hypothetical protein
MYQVVAAEKCTHNGIKDATCPSKRKAGLSSHSGPRGLGLLQVRSALPNTLRGTGSALSSVPRRGALRHEVNFAVGICDEKYPQEGAASISSPSQQ